MTWPRGTVVVAADPFRDEEGAGRPFLLINRRDVPFHGDQYIALSLTTRTWHDDRIPIEADHWDEGGAPTSSSIMPWSVNAITDGWIDYRQGALHEESVETAVARLTEYVE